MTFINFNLKTLVKCIFPPPLSTPLHTTRNSPGSRDFHAEKPCYRKNTTCLKSSSNISLQFELKIYYDVQTLVLLDTDQDSLQNCSKTLLICACCVDVHNQRIHQLELNKSELETVSRDRFKCYIFTLSLFERKKNRNEYAVEIIVQTKRKQTNQWRYPGVSGRFHLSK